MIAISPYSQDTEHQMQKMYHHLPERSRRLYAGIEALKLPYGGISYIARLFNCTRNTVIQGIKDLSEAGTLPPHRSRKKGGGRTPLLTTQTDIDAAFVRILKEHTAGDPMDEKVKWTHLTCVEISERLIEKGYEASPYIVKQLLKKHQYKKRKALKKSLPESISIVTPNLRT